MVLSDGSCDCAVLREQVRSLEAKIALLEQRGPLTADQIATTGGELVPLVDTQASQQRAQAVSASYTGRILLPTFPQRAASGYPDHGLLSSPWYLWGGTLDDEDQMQWDDAGPIWEDAHELVEIFFARRWPQLPVLHKATFVQEHFTPLSQGLPSNSLSHFLVNMVLAIAAAERIGSETRSSTVHRRYFQLAARDIGVVLGADDIDCIQCLLLLIMYGINEPQSVNLYYTIGLALRLAVGIDMHRQEAAPALDLLETEMRKRLWWCVYVMDRSISMALGRPLGIHDSDITTPLPEAVSDDQLGVVEPVPMSSSIVPNPRDVLALIHTVKLRRLNASVYNTFHAAGRSGMDESLTLDAVRQQHYMQLSDWLANAPRYLNPTSMFQTPEWFQIAYHQAIITLYRPSNASPATTIDAIRLCTDSSISLITCYSTLYAKNKISYSFVALNSLFMAAVTMLYSLRASWILRHELTKQVVDHNVRLVASLLREISAGRAVGDYSARIIERLGTGTLNMFDNAPTPDGEVDTEFLTWFGLKCQNLPQPGQPTPSIDIAWNDLLTNGFDMNGSGWTDLLV